MLGYARAQSVLASFLVVWMASTGTRKFQVNPCLQESQERRPQLRVGMRQNYLDSRIGQLLLWSMFHTDHVEKLRMAYCAKFSSFEAPHKQLKQAATRACA